MIVTFRGIAEVGTIGGKQHLKFEQGYKWFKFAT